MNSGLFQMMSKTLDGDLGALRFELDNARKDIRYYTHLAEGLAIPTVMGEAVHQSLALASALGHGKKYVPSLVEAQEQLTGAEDRSALIAARRAQLSPRSARIAAPSAPVRISRRRGAAARRVERLGGLRRRDPLERHRERLGRRSFEQLAQGGAVRLELALADSRDRRAPPSRNRRGARTGSRS